MKKDIHPKYNSAAEVKCVCGNTFTVGSTKDHFEVEICYSCHPFYTGKAKLVDVAGRVEKFKARRAGKSETPVRKKTEKKATNKEKRAK